MTNQKVVPSTTILTPPGKGLCRVKVLSISIPSSSSSSLFKDDRLLSISRSSKSHGGDPVERKIPDAAACVSVGELREAEGLVELREFRAMRM